MATYTLPDLHEQVARGMTVEQYALCETLLDKWDDMTPVNRVKFEVMLAAKDIYEPFYTIVKSLNDKG